MKLNLLGKGAPTLALSKPMEPSAPINVPTFAESAVHKGAQDALDVIDRVLGFAPIARESFLSSSEGRALRNALRRYVIHGNAQSMEPER